MKSKNLSKQILKTVKSKGFRLVELSPVIETNHILQRSGENFRKYLFSFNNSEGKEFALNPDLSLSAILNYAKKNISKREKIFYEGNAFSFGSKSHGQLGVGKGKSILIGTNVPQRINLPRITQVSCGFCTRF